MIDRSSRVGGRRFRALVLCLVVTLCLSDRDGVRAAPAGVTLYVARDGRDSWSGRAPCPTPSGTDGPLATVAAAQAKLRASGCVGPRTILVREGVYRLEHPIVFGPEDSGASADAPMLLAAHPGERPVLSGGRAIAGFRQEGSLWVIDLPEGKTQCGRFRQLFVEGQRRPPARIPDEGYLRMAGPAPPIRGPDGRELSRDKSAFLFRPGDLRPWPDIGGVRLTLVHSWETSVHPLCSIDPGAHIVEFVAPLKEWWRIGHWERDGRYFVENARAGLDRPGEWHLDEATGTLSYYPLPGEKIGETEVVAPALDALVLVQGDPARDRPVAHVRIEGLSFRHSDWTLLPGGNSSTQAAVDVPAAILADGAVDFRIAGCEVAHVGTYAIWLRRGCKDCRIDRNHLHDLGAGGIRLGECRMAAADRDETERVLVENNYLHHGGRVFPAGVGVWVAQSGDNRIAHNEIHDFNYSGVSLGWNWNENPNRTHPNTVEFNHVHHVMGGMLSDGGAIYTLGTQTGTVIRANHFHDVWPYMGVPAMAWGIYLDAGSNGLLIERNVVHHTLTGGLMNTGTNRNTIRNNIFAASAWHALWRYTRQQGPPSRFERNIVCLSQGELFHDDAGRDDRETFWDRNLYWRTDGAPLEFYGMDFEQWRARGTDKSSVIADPRFVDPAAGDYRLRPDSPAPKAIGFQPLDPRACGLHGDPAWIALPRTARPASRPLPPVPRPPPPRPVRDGFETTPEGASPVGATVFGEDAAAGGAVRVTGAAARSGLRSLRVSDSPALDEPWNPHLFYTPHFREGNARLRFALLLKPGARVAVEWRDGCRSPRVGPSLAIDPAGRLVAGGRELAVVPRDAWIVCEMRCALGRGRADGAWTLSVALPGGPTRRFDRLPCIDPRFDALEWLGFVSLARDRTEFFLDDIELSVATAGAADP